jgi:hypothetical protein
MPSSEQILKLVDQMVEANTQRRELQAKGVHTRSSKAWVAHNISERCRNIADELYRAGYSPEQLDDILEARTGSRD